MHPQQPWMLNVHVEQIQREVEQNMRLQLARAAARNGQLGLVSSLRRSLGLALIAAGDRVQPASQPDRQFDPGIELELAR